MLIGVPLAWGYLDSQRELRPQPRHDGATTVPDGALNAAGASPAAPRTPIEKLLAQVNDLYSTGKFAEAEVLASQAVELDPKHAAARKGRGVLRMKLDKLPEALADIQRPPI